MCFSSPFMGQTIFLHPKPVWPLNHILSDLKCPLSTVNKLMTIYTFLWPRLDNSPHNSFIVFMGSGYVLDENLKIKTAPTLILIIPTDSHSSVKEQDDKRNVASPPHSNDERYNSCCGVHLLTSILCICHVCNRPYVPQLCISGLQVSYRYRYSWYSSLENINHLLLH